MRITLPRFILRDFEAADRDAFVSCQMDPRYLRLYDFDPDDEQRAHRLFALFREWQDEKPRSNFQVGIFDGNTGKLCGNVGLRKSDQDSATFGIELAPDEWGRFRLALDAATAMIEFGFTDLGLEMISGDTSSGNTRIERIARWFGAQISARRAGPSWMQAREWEEVNWALRREDWQ